jgi:hypothetical protein
MSEYALTGEFAAQAGVIVGFLVSLLILSAVFGDHWLARLGQYVLVGAALGYAAVVAWSAMLNLGFVREVRAAPGAGAWNWIPIVLGALLFIGGFERVINQTRAGPPQPWQRALRGLALIPVAVLVGGGIAVVLLGTLQGTVVPQFLRAAQIGFDWSAPLDVFLTGALTLLITASALVYFAVVPERHLDGQPAWIRRLMMAWIWLGQRAVWLAAGVIFARLAISRISLFIAQVDYLKAVLGHRDWWPLLQELWRSVTGG